MPMVALLRLAMRTSIIAALQMELWWQVKTLPLYILDRTKMQAHHLLGQCKVVDL
jgi:hypothetical protein